MPAQQELHLGVNLGHDRAAAIVARGEILVAIEEERLDRIKHSPGIRRTGSGYELELPERAIDYCLRALGVDASAITTVTANSPGVDLGPRLARDRFGEDRVSRWQRRRLRRVPRRSGARGQRERACSWRSQRGRRLSGSAPQEEEQYVRRTSSKESSPACI